MMSSCPVLKMHTHRVRLEGCAIALVSLVSCRHDIDIFPELEARILEPWMLPRRNERHLWQRFVLCPTAHGAHRVAVAEDPRTN